MTEKACPLRVSAGIIAQGASQGCGLLPGGWGLCLGPACAALCRRTSLACLSRRSGICRCGRASRQSSRCQSPRQHHTHPSLLHKEPPFLKLP